jgi:membrane associated rhomboid family serine protease
MQFWMGSSQLASMGRGGAEAGGVAFWAHVGGFVVGVAWTLLFRSKRAPAARYRIS